MVKRIILEKEIKRRDFKRGGEVSSKLKEQLRRLGVGAEIIRRVSIVSYELEMNIIIHSLGGKIKAAISSGEIVIKASDRGPGIEDIEKALEPGYSTASEEIREMGFGAGMGLNNIYNYSDDMKINSDPEEGTEVKVKLYL